MAKPKELKPCRFAPACPNKISLRKTVCPACYQHLFWHSRQGIAHIIKYAQKVDKAYARTQVLMSARGKRKRRTG